MKAKWIKVLSLVLCFAMVFGGVIYSQAEPGAAVYKPGTYTATAKGNNGDVTVEVKFNANSMVSAKVIKHSETAGLSDAPIARIPQAVVAGQTLAVDTVAGATVVSNAILAAIEQCVVQAGGNVSALKGKKAEANTVKSETQLTTDVVVVGAGGTGLTAAASAYQNGADVIVLEKLAYVGGSTALSGGSISATGTKFQKAEGIADTKESWMKLWKERQAASNPSSIYPDYKRVDKFMDEAVKTTEWLVDYVGHQYGNIGGFGVDPVRRLHNPKPNGKATNGSALIQNIERFVRGKGIRILTETPATELLTNSKGDVVGVLAKGKDGNIRISAKKVILATGGYAKNEELLERFIPKAAGTAKLSAASAGSTGDGIIMAENIGAALYEDPWVIGLSIASTIKGTEGMPWDWTKVYVNERGERYVNEQSHYAIVTNKAMEQGITWVIVDSSKANEALIASLEAAMPSKEVVKANTLDALAREMYVPADTFVKTMETFNNGVKAGKDVMGKEKQLLVAVEKAPYYAVRFYPRTMGTFAGVKTDETFRVLRKDGTVINNLYAGGECANKIMYNQVYMTGSAVQYALTSGRIAGKHAAQNLK